MSKLLFHKPLAVIPPAEASVGFNMLHVMRAALRPCTPERLVNGPIRLGLSVLLEYRIQ
jgi:hypothetical protein